eukprot:scaffold94671_cov18-Tisochrysis_lutea.AAC.5
MACADVVTSTPSSVSNPIKITSPSSSVGSLPEGAERLHLGMIFCMLTVFSTAGITEPQLDLAFVVFSLFFH